MTPLFRRAGFTFLALLFVVVTHLPARAQDATPGTQQDTCAAATKAVDITINNPKGRVIYNTGVSRNDLVRLRQSRSRVVQNSNWKPLGLTLSDFRFQINTSASLLPIANDQFCAYPNSFDITIGYSGFKVYIDRRYGKGGCEHRAVLDHENTHVSLYRSNLSRSLPDLKRAVYSAARGIVPVIVDTPNQGARYMQEQMETKLEPLIARLSRGADVANARIDTVTSYKNVQRRCRNW